jgi:hyperosmotically inducible protein
MKIVTTARTVVSATLLLCSVMFATAIARQPDAQQDSPSADNSKVNQRDQSTNAPTADQQKNNRTDQGITQQIRRSIMADKSLSTYAHNVKIVTQGGMVTLKGPVRSEAEKQTIASLASQVVGANKVTNEIDIKPKQ